MFSARLQTTRCPYLGENERSILGRPLGELAGIKEMPRRGSAIIVALIAVLLAQVLPSSAAESLTAQEQTSAVHTVFVLRRAVPLAAVAQALENTGARPLAFDHLGETRGGFLASGMPLDRAVTTYRALYGPSHATNPEPQVISFRLEGVVTPGSLTGLEQEIIIRDEVPAAARVAVTSIDTGSPQVAVFLPWEALESPGSSSNQSVSESASTLEAGAKPYAWMPDDGTIVGTNDSGDPERPREIRHTLTWGTAGDIAAFGDNAYEHDLKLFANIGEGGYQPVCQNSVFWANRNAGLEFDHNLPDATAPYVDTEVSDPCQQMDLTIGLFHPAYLTAGTTYEIEIRASSGEFADESVFELAAQSLPNNCATGDHPLCVGITPGQGAAIIDDGDDCVLPGAYNWVSGSSQPCPYPLSRASVNSSLAQGNQSSWSPSISNSGRYVTFVSDASNLVSGDTNGVRDIFLRDRVLGSTARISVSSSGSQANGASNVPSISADGRYVSFESLASNLVASDTNNIRDIFVHDRTTGETVRVSISSTGAQASGGSWPDNYNSDISGDGRFVTFQSAATNLVTGDTNDIDDIFVHDRDLEDDGVYDESGMIETTRVSIGPGGVEAHDGAARPSISDDGETVTFVSWSTNLVADDANDTSDVFAHDRIAGTTELISVSSVGTQGNAESGEGRISGNGRYITFQSSASNLVSGDTNNNCLGYPPPLYEPGLVNCQDVFAHDLLLGTTRLVSASYFGVSGNSHSNAGAISNNGRYVVFSSSASDIVLQDLNEKLDVFLRDLIAGTNTRLSVDAFGEEGNGYSFSGPIVMSNGEVFAAFESTASNLVVGDTNGSRDVFVYQKPAE